MVKKKTVGSWASVCALSGAAPIPPEVRVAVVCLMLIAIPATALSACSSTPGKDQPFDCTHEDGHGSARELTARRAAPATTTRFTRSRLRDHS